MRSDFLSSRDCSSLNNSIRVPRHAHRYLGIEWVVLREIYVLTSMSFHFNILVLPEVKDRSVCFLVVLFVTNQLLPLMTDILCSQ